LHDKARVFINQNAQWCLLPQSKLDLF